MTLTEDDKLEEYGVYDWLRSVNQMTFAKTSTCWMASAINIALNIYQKIPYNKEEFEDFVQNKYTNDLGRKVPLGNWWAPWIAWAKRVKQYYSKIHNVFISIRRFDIFSKQFYSYLDKWHLCAVAININDDIRAGLLNQLINKPTSRPFSSWHWIVVGKDAQWYFILNSWYPKTNKVRITDLELDGIVKRGTESYTFIATNKGRQFI